MSSRLLFMQGLVLYSDSGDDDEDEEQQQEQEQKRHARPHGASDDNDGNSKRPRLQLPSAEQLLGDNSSEGAHAHATPSHA